MAGSIKKFFFASMLMWIAPIVILYGFNHQLFQGVTELSSSSQTLLSGVVAAISVNVVIVFYIFMAMKETLDSEHKPDPKFLAEAIASMKRPAMEKMGDSSQSRSKEE